MKWYTGIALILCVLSAGFVATEFVAAQTKQAESGEDAIVRDDHAVVAAFEKGDTATLNKLLDADFSWIDTDGIMWAKEDALAAGLKPLVPNGPDVEITEHKYGKVVWIQDHVGNKYAAHFWVQRPSGWKLLHTNEIAARPTVPGQNVRPDYDIPCINPCKEIPYKPLTPNEKAAILNWQDQEGANGPGHHDMHMGSHETTIGSNSMNPQPSKTATGPTPVTPVPGRPMIGTAPALYVRMWDFGTAVVSVMCQPTYGGKAYWSSRVFAQEGGLWKMEESYHTTIQASPIMTAVDMKKLQGSKTVAPAE
jgi:hypothetical protein